MRKKLCDAISKSVVVEFQYNGHQRVVEPHAVGVTTAGNDVLRGYQTAGGSSSRTVPYWKMFKLQKIESLTDTNEQFNGPRRGYSPNDDHMSKIYCQF